MAYLEDLFLRFRGGFAAFGEDDASEQPCVGSVAQAVDYVVNGVEPRLRALSSYARRLKGRVVEAFRYIDELAETVPGAYECSRFTFADDPRVNAFFVDPLQLQEVFSQAREVRELFDADPTLEECCACTRRSEASSVLR
jgi:hypothetical protein